MSQKSFAMPLFLEKVRGQKSLDEAEICHFIQNLTSFPDEQVSAFLAHAYHQPLSAENKVHLTLAMRDSGSKLNWRGLDKPVVDKHSTGGIGDKITIVLAPLLASLGLVVPTIAGRGLGFSGGTVDKLEAIPGFSLDLGCERMQSQARELGLCFGAQSDDIAPADRKLYALRDVTATVESIPLITASILSKKLAESLGYLVLDVKWGSGAFMRTLAQARELASSLVETANGAGVKTRAVITDMNQPLGLTSGNWCEVVECVRLLKNDAELTRRVPDIMRLTLDLAAHLLCLSGLENDHAAAVTRAERELASGRPFEVFCRVVKAQGGDVRSVEGEVKLLPATAHTLEIKAKADGSVAAIDTKALGQALVLAHAGRQQRADRIDHAVSLEHPVKIGAPVRRGEILCTLHYNDEGPTPAVKELLEQAFTIQQSPVQPPELIAEVIS